MGETEAASAARQQARAVMYQAIVDRAKLQLLTEQTLRRLANVPRLAYTPLVAVSRVILPAADDDHLPGRVRREPGPQRGTRWPAVPDGGRPVGARRDPQRAASELARAAGHSAGRPSAIPAEEPAPAVRRREPGGAR
jgi:hypothetical protein